jgi:hypothetical protein
MRYILALTCGYLVVYDSRTRVHACQTATGSVRHLDEAIHLAAAMQFLGYRHVIATMWTIADLARLRRASPTPSTPRSNKAICQTPAEPPKPFTRPSTLSAKPTSPKTRWYGHRTSTSASDALIPSAQVARGDARIRLALVQVSPSGKHRHPAARYRPVPRCPVQQPLPVRPRIQAHRRKLTGGSQGLP